MLAKPRVVAVLVLFASSCGVLFAQAGRQAIVSPGVSGTGHPPSTFGTAVTSYYTVNNSEMTAIDTGFTYSCFNNCQLRYVTNNTGTVLTATAHLPAGALVTYLELDFSDTSTTGEVQLSFGVCDRFSDVCLYQPGNCSDSPVTLCSGNTNAPGFGSISADMSGLGITVDNFNSNYTLSLGTTTNDGTTAISQVIIGYTLQVSPPPAISDFGDVSTSSPQFPFIEALFHAGITAGCGGGNFCPNSPLTRGQMAVFLAKALGLQWP